MTTRMCCVAGVIVFVCVCKGSLLAWRHALINDAAFLINKALWCCGDPLADSAAYLKYELGHTTHTHTAHCAIHPCVVLCCVVLCAAWFYFMKMEWDLSARHLTAVMACVLNTQDKIFLPHKESIHTSPLPFPPLLSPCLSVCVCVQGVLAMQIAACAFQVCVVPPDALGATVDVTVREAGDSPHQWLRQCEIFAQNSSNKSRLDDDFGILTPTHTH